MRGQTALPGRSDPRLFPQSSRHSKLEKADILEMTVKHLRSLQRAQMTGESRGRTGERELGWRCLQPGCWAHRTLCLACSVERGAGAPGSAPASPESDGGRVLCSVPVFLVALHLNSVYWRVMGDTVLRPCYWGMLRGSVFCASIPNKETLGRSLLFVHFWCWRSLGGLQSQLKFPLLADLCSTHGSVLAV